MERTPPHALPSALFPRENFLHCQQSTSAALRLANSLSNGEIISFADEFTTSGDVARKNLQVVKARQDVFRIMRPAHHLAHRLLQDRLRH